MPDEEGGELFGDRAGGNGEVVNDGVGGVGGAAIPAGGIGVGGQGGLFSAGEDGVAVVDVEFAGAVSGVQGTALEAGPVGEFFLGGACEEDGFDGVGVIGIGEGGLVVGDLEEERGGGGHDARGPGGGVLRGDEFGFYSSGAVDPAGGDADAVATIGAADGDGVVPRDHVVGDCAAVVHAGDGEKVVTRDGEVEALNLVVDEEAGRGCDPSVVLDAAVFSCRWRGTEAEKEGEVIGRVITGDVRDTGGDAGDPLGGVGIVAEEEAGDGIGVA